jgi:hypothetical protein
MCGGGDECRTCATPKNWGHVRILCNPCYKRYEIYHSSGCTDLTYGCPYVLNTNYFETDSDKPRVLKEVLDAGTLLTCGQCGKSDKNVVRNYYVHYGLTGYGLDPKYKHCDFCKNAVCCKAYVSYADYTEVVEASKHLVKPAVW